MLSPGAGCVKSFHQLLRKECDVNFFSFKVIKKTFFQFAFNSERRGLTQNFLKKFGSFLLIHIRDFCGWKNCLEKALTVILTL